MTECLRRAAEKTNERSAHTFGRAKAALSCDFFDCRSALGFEHGTREVNSKTLYGFGRCYSGVEAKRPCKVARAHSSFVCQVLHCQAEMKLCARPTQKFLKLAGTVFEFEKRRELRLSAHPAVGHDKVPGHVARNVFTAIFGHHGECEVYTCADPGGCPNRSVPNKYSITFQFYLGKSLLEIEVANPVCGGAPSVKKTCSSQNIRPRTYTCYSSRLRCCFTQKFQRNQIVHGVFCSHATDNNQCVAGKSGVAVVCLHGHAARRADKARFCAD